MTIQNKSKLPLIKKAILFNVYSTSVQTINVSLGLHNWWALISTQYTKIVIKNISQTFSKIERIITFSEKKRHQESCLIGKNERRNLTERAANTMSNKVS